MLMVKTFLNAKKIKIVWAHLLARLFACVFAILIIVGAVIFSILSLFVGGGWLIGLIFGLVGGILGLLKK
jgi:hypothetical protein